MNFSSPEGLMTGCRSIYDKRTSEGPKCVEDIKEGKEIWECSLSSARNYAVDLPAVTGVSLKLQQAGKVSIKVIYIHFSPTVHETKIMVGWPSVHGTSESFVSQLNDGFSSDCGWTSALFSCT